MKSERPVEAQSEPALDAGRAPGNAAPDASVVPGMAAHERAAPLPVPETDAGWETQSELHGVEGPGARIGPYKLLQLLGEGGFGAVYLAEQSAPVRRDVALKLIKAGMDTRQVVARFEQERQALALMEHPNIARVLDAGTTDSGRPYFVMELVRGPRITEYCDQHRLTTRARLELFVPICQAVQHAHQKGIIHRDLKPSNVLVALIDGRPVPKVIDFGVAKATGARLTEQTLFTEERQWIGTPAYMSPEQAGMGGLDVDTRSDVYSLGVLLYELLTGTTPFDTRALFEAGFGEVQRVIQEVDPPRPSTRVGALGGAAHDIASRRSTQPEELRKLVRGDIDWIVMKALEKDRTRRYETALGLGLDVVRHLEGRPVEAAPPSSVYRLKKFVRRRRGLVLAASAVLLALLAGVVSTGLALRDARAAYASEKKALEGETVQRQRAERTTYFLCDVLASIDPDRAAGRDLTVKEFLDAAAARVGSELAEEPEVAAALRQTIGATYRQLGRYDEAKKQHEEAAELHARVLGREHPETLVDRYGVGLALVQLGEREPGVRVLEETLAAQARVLGPADERTLQTRSVLGFARQLGGDAEGALAIYRSVLADQRAALGAGHTATLETMSSLADVLQALGQLEEAERVARELVAAATESKGPDGTLTTSGRSILVSILNDRGRYAEAEPIARDVLAAKQRIYGPDHPQALVTASVLASTLQNLDRFDEASVLLRHAAEAAARGLGGEHDTTLTYLGNLARSEQLAGRLDEAEELMRRVLGARLRTGSENDVLTASVLTNLGLLLLSRDRPQEAEEHLLRAHDGLARTLSADHWMVGQSKVNLSQALLDQSRFEEAERLLTEGYGLLVRALSEAHPRAQRALQALVALNRAWGRPERAAEWEARGAAASR